MASELTGQLAGSQMQMPALAHEPADQLNSDFAAQHGSCHLHYNVIWFPPLGLGALIHLGC